MYMRLKDNYTVNLHDLRNDPDKVKHFSAKGMNVNDGMVVTIDQADYYGSEAISVLGKLSDAGKIRSWIFYKVFSSKVLSKSLYPVMVKGRKCLLNILGRDQIEVKTEAQR